jgi:hypothetical protein
MSSVLPALAAPYNRKELSTRWRRRVNRNREVAHGVVFSRCQAILIPFAVACSRYFIALFLRIRAQ